MALALAAAREKMIPSALAAALAVAFIAISEKEVKLISLKEKETIWEKILKPEVGEKIYNKLMGIAETTAETADNATEGNKKD